MVLDIMWSVGPKAVIDLPCPEASVHNVNSVGAYAAHFLGEQVYLPSGEDEEGDGEA